MTSPASESPSRQPTLGSGTRTRLRWIVLVLAFGIGALWINGPALMGARELQRRLVCSRNLQAIAAGAVRCGDLGGLSSADVLSTLAANGKIRPQQAVCPSSGTGPPNYVLVALDRPVALDRSRPLPDGAVVAYEPKSNHAGKGGNVVFADGHAEFVEVPRYDQLIAQVESQHTRPSP